MKDKYEEPKITVIRFETVDVITASEDIGEWDINK